MIEFKTDDDGIYWEASSRATGEAFLPQTIPFCDCTAVLMPPPTTAFELGGQPSYTALGVCSICYQENAPRSDKYGDGPAPSSGEPN